MRCKNSTTSEATALLAMRNRWNAFLKSFSCIGSNGSLMFHVFRRAGKQSEIRNSIVVFDSVNVMYFFIWFQRSSKVLLHYVSVFQDSTIFGCVWIIRQLENN